MKTKGTLGLLLACTILGFNLAQVRGQQSKPSDAIGVSGTGRPWVQRFVAKRQFYISPSGTGSGELRTKPDSLINAIKKAKPGDLFWILSGTYTGSFQFTKGGTAENPIIFRAAPQNHVVINGSVECVGPHNWIWGLEITDPTQNTKDEGAAVRMLAPGVHVINNVIHHNVGNSGIGAWNKGAGQVVYGNIVYENGKGPNHPHNIYTQNDFSKYGYKYIVNNMFLDSATVCHQCFNVNAYTTNTTITGFHFERNIIRGGRFLVGGYGTPAANEVVIENYFYNSQAQFGYRRPTQIEFKNNYLVRTPLHLKNFWGVGETRYNQTAPNVITGNEIILSPGNHIEFKTSAYSASKRSEGAPKIQPTDIVNYNKYSLPFRAYFFANNTELPAVTFEQWKSATAAAGNAFDTNSSLSPKPKGVKIILLSNEYEQGRAHLAIFNWDKGQSVTVDLSTVISNGQNFEVYKAKSAFSDPVQSGTYLGPVSIPTQGEEFLVFVVRGN